MITMMTAMMNQKKFFKIHKKSSGLGSPFTFGPLGLCLVCPVVSAALCVALRWLYT